MGMAMPVTMAMTVESGTAEAAICRGATLNEASVRAERSIWHAPGTAIDTGHKAHRYSADRRGTHHGQDYTARTFHAITCAHIRRVLAKPSLGIQASALRQSCDRRASRSPPFHRIVRDADRVA